MPIYEYQACDERACDTCHRPFERLQKLSETPLEQCPDCGAPVRRLISAVNISRSDTSLSRGNLENHGFTQYKRVAKGQYEKTAGGGPETLSDD